MQAPFGRDDLEAYKLLSILGECGAMLRVDMGFYIGIILWGFQMSSCVIDVLWAYLKH